MTMVTQAHTDLVTELADLYEEIEASLKVVDLVLGGKVSDHKTAILLVSMYRAEMFRITDDLRGVIKQLKTE